MPELEIAIPRPQRWDEPFGTMTERDVDQLLAIEPFRSIDASAFPASLPLRGILGGDTRIVHYDSGDIVVRQGDYGHSAFLVLSGTVRVALGPLDPELLGREPPRHRGWKQAIAQVWQNARLPEVRRAFGLDAACRSGCATGDESAVTGLPAGTREIDGGTRVFLQDVPRLLERTGSVQLGTGEIFGELAALSRTPRTATVIADGAATLLEIRWQGLRDLMRRAPALRQHIERLYRENSLRVHLRETPLLADLPAEALDRVADATVFESYGNFDWHSDFNAGRQQTLAEQIAMEPLIAAEGDAPSGLYLIRSGFARVSHRHGHGQRTVAYLGKGQVFGLEELVASVKADTTVAWRHSLRAVGYVDVLRIPAEIVLTVVLPHVDLARVQFLRIGAAVGEPARCEDDASTRVESQLLDFFADHRFLNGTQTMVINLDRCTRCDDCVRACAATHDNNPRFIRQGPKHGQLMVANACMHCIDPVCMIGCPTGAIGRDVESGTVRINDRTCVGCGTCANSCPYSAIRMVEIREPGGAIVMDEVTRQPILKATKCDFCASQLTGPACQHACPHDALLRVDMWNVEQLPDWLGR